MCAEKSPPAFFSFRWFINLVWENIFGKAEMDKNEKALTLTTSKGVDATALPKLAKTLELKISRFNITDIPSTGTLLTSND